jgi:translation elongation factor EF-G
MLLEPMMRLEIVAPQEYSPSINVDLVRRRVEVQEIDMRGNNKASKFFFVFVINYKQFKKLFIMFSL